MWTLLLGEFINLPKVQQPLIIVTLGFLWDTIISYNSLPTGLWASALKSSQHGWLSEPFKREVPSRHSLLETLPQLLIFPQNESQGPHLGLRGLFPISSTLLLPNSAPPTHTSWSFFHHSKHVPFWGREGCLCICPPVRMLLP